MGTSYPIDVRIDPTAAQAGGVAVERSLRGIDARARLVQGTLLKLFGGAALFAGVRRGTGLLREFGQEMSTVRAVSQATESQFTALQAKAESLGRNTRFSASQAAEGMTFLARAGFSADQVLGSIEGTLQLAQAGALGLGRAADIASNVLQGFQLEVEETGRVVDVLALAANSSNTSVSQLGDALSFAAPIASGLGVSLEEATAAIGALSNAGLQASRAGTGLNRVLAELESPTAATRDVLQSLGVATEDVRISSVGLSSALRTLEASGITTGQALEAFGQRGGPAADILLKTFTNAGDADSALVSMTRSLENAGGTAQRVAETMDDNLNGAILALRSSVEGFVLAMGQAGAETALINLVDGLTAAFRFLADNTELVTLALAGFAIQITATALTPLIASAYASTTAFLAQTAALRLSTVALIGANTAARALGASLLAFAAANPVLLGIAAIGGAYLLLKRNAVDAGEAIQATEGLLGNYRTATTGVERDTDLLRRRTEELEGAIREIGTAAQSAAAIELSAISERIKKNEELRGTYRALLQAQLATAKAAATTEQDSFLRRFSGVEQIRSTNPGAGGSSVLGLDSASSVEFTPIEEYRKIATQAIEEKRASLVAAALAGDILSEADQKFLTLATERIETEAKIQNLTQALREIDGARAEPVSGGGGGGAGGGGSSGLAADFAKEFTALQELTKAIGTNRAAQERANAVRQFAGKFERDLTAAELARVDAEIRLQQVANDNQAQRLRVQDLEKENELMRLGSREAEIRAAVYNAERASLLGLSPAQKTRIRDLLTEQQLVRDTRVISDRLDALEDEAFLLTKIGTEARVWTEVLRLQNQLERDLTDTEISWIGYAVTLNDELARRNGILRDAREPAQEARRNMEALRDLYGEAAITLGQYNAALQDNRVANDVRSLDDLLNQSGQNVQTSVFEEERRRTETLLRRQEGGGVDDGADQTLLGFNANELGVGGENERIREETQERLELIRQAREEELLTEQEFANRKTAILNKGIQDQRNALLTGLQTQLSAAENLFGSITDIAARTAGEQSGIYKAAFAIEKAVAIARSVVAIQQGIAQAAALPFPANLGAMATVAAATGSIVSNIQSVRLKFADGGLPGAREGGRSASLPTGLIRGPGGPREDAILARVSNQEFISNAETTNKNLALHYALNNDPDLLRRAGVDASTPEGVRNLLTSVAANDNSSIVNTSSLTNLVNNASSEVTNLTNSASSNVKNLTNNAVSGGSNSAVSRSSLINNIQNVGAVSRISNFRDGGLPGSPSFTKISNFRDGGLPGSPNFNSRTPDIPSAPRPSGGSPRTVGAGGRVVKIDVGGISMQIDLSGDITRDRAQEIGDDIGRQIIIAILQEETNIPGGVIYDKVTNG